ncbi:MAG: hypothetical protein JWQ81_8551 [Amycolatopsis sp.]|jgi:hypothetical protein|uniref:hypothetical protein n=1 Tax=Amycolatopsis sp. TaxID=37632 RepID=UPI00261067F2|nr:hypothetical protein [Amycolatopsis sp.]MCU1687812.1 hypothetical protein [Amycolatopsis sp.]
MSTLLIWTARASVALSTIVCLLVVGTIGTDFFTASPVTVAADVTAATWFYASYVALVFTLRAA